VYRGCEKVYLHGAQQFLEHLRDVLTCDMCGEKIPARHRHQPGHDEAVAGILLFNF